MKRVIQLIFVLTLFGCNKDENIEPIPDIVITENEFTEGDVSNILAAIPLQLSATYNRALNITYSTSEASALNDIDFIPTEGILTFQPGEIEKELIIEIVSDKHMEISEEFELQLVIEGEITTHIINILDNDYTYTIQKESEGFITPDTYPSMRMIWSDEFEGNALNTNNWGYDLGDGCDLGICGWGNEELQSYTDQPENIYLENSNLHIVAQLNPQYTSARIQTAGLKEFQFGRIDIRAKLPYGQGIWPAIWMLGANIGDVGWPKSGEIDIMEMIGSEPLTVHGTVHYDNGGYQSTGRAKSITKPESFSEEFHVFSVVWDRNSIKWYVDYDEYFFVTKSSLGENYPFNNPFYFLLNVAIGGKWPGNPDETTVFPQEMVLDYVRVFQ